MLFDSTAPRRIPRWLAHVALPLFGVGLALLLVEGALRLFPSLRPDGRPRGENLGRVEYTVGMGDLFIHQPGWIAPPDDPYVVLSAHPLAWDADGFRVPARPAEHYDVLALGDSYTEASNVARPWPDVLAEASGLAVRNLGFRGYGPLEEARVMQEYGADAGAATVIIAFFEGNDFSDISASTWGPGFVLPGIARGTFNADDPDAWRSDHDGPFKYPLRMALNGETVPVVFLEAYLAWLNGARQDYLRSRNADLLRQSWADVITAAGDACVIVAYLPTKEHLYVPYVVPDDQPRLLESLGYVFLQVDGLLRTLPEAELPEAERRTYADVLARLDHQRDALALLAAEAGLPFFDLTPFFQEAAARGEVLYYTYDTHWNQAGHDLAGAALADFLAAAPCG